MNSNNVSTPISATRNNTPRRTPKKTLDAEQTYTFANKRFIVEPVFKGMDDTQSGETLGEILLKLLLDKGTPP